MEVDFCRALEIVSAENGNDEKLFLRGEDLKNLLLQENIRNRRIVAISICGAVGTGKSFLLSFFLRFLRASYVQHNPGQWLGKDDDPLIGFEWRGDIDPVTQGLCIWPEVFLHESQSGEQYAIVVTDTQGIIGSKFSITQDLTMLALTTCLSSTLIYNVHKSFNFTDLMQFQVLIDFLKNKECNNVEEVFKNKEKNESEVPFTNVVVIVRDFETTQTTYGWKNVNEIGNKSQFKNLKILQQLFKNVHCYTMCYPKCEMEDSEFFDGSFGMLSPKFMELLEPLPKTMLSPEIIETSKWFTAEQFVNGFKSIIEEVDRYTTHSKALAAVAESKALYVKEMTKSIRIATKTKVDEASKFKQKSPKQNHWNPFSLFHLVSNIARNSSGTSKNKIEG